MSRKKKKEKLFRPLSTPHFKHSVAPNPANDSQMKFFTHIQSDLKTNGLRLMLFRSSWIVLFVQKASKEMHIL